MKLNYPQYLEDLRKAYVGRVATITGGHGQAGRTGRITAMQDELTSLAITIEFFSPAEPRTAVVRRLDHLKIEPVPA